MWSCHHVVRMGCHPLPSSAMIEISNVSPLLHFSARDHLFLKPEGRKEHFYLYQSRVCLSNHYVLSGQIFSGMSYSKTIQSFQGKGIHRGYHLTFELLIKQLSAMCTSWAYCMLFNFSSAVECTFLPPSQYVGGGHVSVSFGSCLRLFSGVRSSTPLQDLNKIKGTELSRNKEYILESVHCKSIFEKVTFS